MISTALTRRMVLHLLSLTSILMNAKANQSTTTIFIDVMTSTNSPSDSNFVSITAGGFIFGSQWLATKLINNDSRILEDYTLELRLYNAQGDKSKAIHQAIDICTLSENGPISDDGSITIPMVLGLPTTSLSETVNPILSAYGWSVCCT